MRLLDRLGLAQRIVVTIGLAMVLGVLTEYVTSIGGPFGANFGWFGYAPLTASSVVGGGADLSAWEQLLVWIGAASLWTTVALFIFKRPSVAADGQR